MKNLLKRYQIQLTIGIGTLVFVVLFPIMEGGTFNDSYSFTASFGQYALISYLVYLVLSALSNAFFQDVPTRVTHITAFVIAYFYFIFMILGVITQGVNIGI